MEKGYLAIILHAHLPYVRHVKHKDALEENWLFEAITDTYIPLISILEELAGKGLDYRLTLTLTPTLCSMLRDPLLQSRYVNRLQQLIELATKEVRRTQSQPEFNVLARMYHKRFLSAYETFVTRYEKNLIQVFARLQEAGKIEVLASAATHGYLPLLSVNASAVRAQIRVGIESYREMFGRRPKGFWLPECGYYPGVDELLKENGIRYTILETHGLTHAESRPKYGVYAPLYCPSGVAVFGRDPESSNQVWSATEGYPGDPDYREYYRDIGLDLDMDYIGPYIHKDGIRINTGLKYYRITGNTENKQVYVPEWAEGKAKSQAADFLSKKQAQVEDLAQHMDRTPLLVAPYDAELFGHWWFEGPRWLDYLLRKIMLDQERIRLITLSEYLEEYPINQVSVPSASSWGEQGFHRKWLNESNDWIYRHLHRAADIMERLTGDYPQSERLVKRALDQAARELLLAQSSDWAFIMSAGTMTQYAEKRVKTHLKRFKKLAEGIASDSIDEAWLSGIERRDNIFPRLDYRIFA